MVELDLDALLTPVARQQLARIALAKGIGPADAAREILERHLQASAAHKCRFPPCPSDRVGGGLCQRHYMRARYYVKQGILNRDWLVSIGRMTDLPGQTLPIAEETLEVLPKSAKVLLRPDEFTHWLFDHPRATAKVQRLLAEQVRARRPK